MRNKYDMNKYKFLIKIKNCPTTCHAGAEGERRYSSYSFLTSALDGVSGQCTLPPGKDPWYHWIGSSMGFRTGLDTEARRKILCL
jgi:hypothetical protein